jgi:hypothetical protein
VRDLIPSPVFDSLQEHLRAASENAVKGWDSNKDEEDSLTGDLGRVLATHRDIYINVGRDPWRWRVAYKKFRGRGDGAFESTTGADGIIQVEVTIRGETFFKGVLFQAKKVTRFRNSEVRKQIISIEKFAPGGSAVLLYGPRRYRAIKGTEYLQPDKRLVGSTIKKMPPLASFFDEFLECKSGIRGMYFDAVREQLLLPTIDGQVKAEPLEVGSRIKIEIASR